MASIEQLREVHKMADDNVVQWRAFLQWAEQKRLDGDEQPYLRGITGFKGAKALEGKLKVLLGFASAWPSVNGFGVLSQKKAVDPASPLIVCCAFKDCDKPVFAIGLCSRHYRQNYRAINPVVRSACVDGRKNHSYDKNEVGVHCKAPRAYSP